MEKGLSGGGGEDEEETSAREARQEGNASAAEYGLSATKHPLNNSVINSPGRLRRPPVPSASFRRMFGIPRDVRGVGAARSFCLSPLSPSLPPSPSLSLSFPASLSLFPSVLTFATCVFLPLFHSPSPRCYSLLCSPPILSSAPSRPSRLLTNYV